MVKKRVNFNLEENVHHQLKQIALDNKTTVTDLLTKWIVEAIEKETNQTTLEME